ncbi:hypothetical protein [Acinetobacter radioresistens]|uniref:hypothetical protein n=1 Tax=Acinetobacter radioresistens TaxID=40216 RepID=UPI000DAE0BC2|nr:hypothetical protein [Acinetobacter radioresistens]AWV86186.1 hypothetical protein DOM24_06190 [Acinetobacter radioresistens]MCX0327674.1 hypothetical protein [Acinetobacter radioresistens]
MVFRYKVTFRKLISSINRKLEENGRSIVRHEERYSNIEPGAIEKLEEYYRAKGYDFDWEEENNLFVAIITPQ